MIDVARLAGVSIKTVSRVVNEESGVHPTTAQQVLNAIEQLGFRRNLGARNLRRGSSSGTIGIITEDVGNPFYSAITRAVEEVAREFGRQVLTGSSAEDPEREQEMALEFCARRVDGMLVVPAGEQHDYLIPEMQAGMPVVFLDRPPGDIKADTVLVDNSGGAALAVQHLVEHGHTRIAFLGDSLSIFTAAERLRGFRQGHALVGLPYEPGLIAMGPHNEKTVVSALHKVLTNTQPATAVITGNNRITVHVLRALAQQSNRPALIGFDDFELADLLRPPITVIAHDAGQLGEASAKLLFSRLEGKTGKPRQIVLPVKLIPRGSGEQRP